MNNNATLVLLGIYHGQANPDRIIIADIDKLISMADKFEDRYGDTDWENTDHDWADTLARWYNDTKDSNWNILPMASDDPYFKVKQETGKYLSLTEDEDSDAPDYINSVEEFLMETVSKAMAEIERLQKTQETIADIAYMAGTHHYYSGNSRADMQTFIHLADKFEEEYKDVDWNAQAEEEDSDAPDYINSVEEFFNENLRIVDKLAFDYPNGTRYEWDNVEIAGCKDDGDSTYRVDDGDDETPDFYTVYLHLTEGGTMAVADLPTEKLAQDCAEMLHNAVISFKDNGFLPLSRNAELHRKFNLLLDERIKMASSVQTKAAYEIVKDQFNSLIKP